MNIGMMDVLGARRSYYAIGRDLPVSEEKVLETIEKVTELVPDAYNIKSQHVVVVTGEKQDLLWDSIYDVFGGQVAREKIDSFKAGYGTVLFFINQDKVKALAEQFPLYKDAFPGFSLQANGMLQINIWTALRGLDIGASLQHYNPVIDEKVRELFDIPESWTLMAEMPFGNILQEPEAKEKEDIKQRVWHIS